MTLIYVYYSFHNMNIILYSLLVITIYLCITYSIIKYKHIYILMITKPIIILHVTITG